MITILAATEITPFLLKNNAVAAISSSSEFKKEWGQVKDNIQITISAAGDCTLGNQGGQPRTGSFDDVYAKNKNNPDYFFRNVTDIFAKDDLTIINLEGPLTLAGQAHSKTGKTTPAAAPETKATSMAVGTATVKKAYYWFKGKPAYAALLAKASVEAANLANNHAMDYGQAGYKETVAALEKNEIKDFGEPTTAYFVTNGLKVAMLGYKVNSSKTAQKISKDIAAAKISGADIVITSFHWGTELATKPDALQKKLGRLAIDSGADLVLGQHPHVIQPIETYKGRHIVYSLGNFCFGGNLNPKDKDTFIFSETIGINPDGNRSYTGQVIPCRISSTPTRNDFVPTPVSGKDAARIIKRTGFSGVSH